MKGIDILVEEHRNIKRFLDLIGWSNLALMEGQELDIDLHRDAIDFIKNYADTIHHGKEEKLLFKYMLDDMGRLGQNLITHGMLVEHDLARYYVMAWEEALLAYVETGEMQEKLDILAYSMAYRDLLTRHIDKEDRLVYSLASRSLDEKVLRELEERTEEFQARPGLDQEIAHYLATLNKYENKYKKPI